MISPLVVEGGTTYEGWDNDTLEQHLIDTSETEPHLSQNVQSILDLVKSHNYMEERNELFKPFKNEENDNETSGGYGQASLFFGSEEIKENEEYTGADEYFEW